MKFRKVRNAGVQKLDVIRFFIDTTEKAEKLRKALSLTQSVKSVTEIEVGQWTQVAAESSDQLHTFVNFVNLN